MTSSGGTCWVNSMKEIIEQATLTNEQIDDIIGKLQKKKRYPIKKIVIQSNDMLECTYISGLKSCWKPEYIDNMELDENLILCVPHISNSTLLFKMIQQIVRMGYRLKDAGYLLGNSLEFKKESCCNLD